MATLRISRTVRCDGSARGVPLAVAALALLLCALPAGAQRASLPDPAFVRLVMSDATSAVRAAGAPQTLVKELAAQQVEWGFHAEALRTLRDFSGDGAAAKAVVAAFLDRGDLPDALAAVLAVRESERDEPLYEIVRMSEQLMDSTGARVALARRMSVAGRVRGLFYIARDLISTNPRRAAEILRELLPAVLADTSAQRFAGISNFAYWQVMAGDWAGAELVAREAKTPFETAAGLMDIARALAAIRDPRADSVKGVAIAAAQRSGNAGLLSLANQGRTPYGTYDIILPNTLERFKRTEARSDADRARAEELDRLVTAAGAAHDLVALRHVSDSLVQFGMPMFGTSMIMGMVRSETLFWWSIASPADVATLSAILDNAISLGDRADSAYSDRIRVQVVRILAPIDSSRARQITRQIRGADQQEDALSALIQEKMKGDIWGAIAATDSLSSAERRENLLVAAVGILGSSGDVVRAIAVSGRITEGLPRANALVGSFINRGGALDAASVKALCEAALASVDPRASNSSVVSFLRFVVAARQHAAALAWANNQQGERRAYALVRLFAALPH